jgi:hypothetical protein
VVLSAPESLRALEQRLQLAFVLCSLFGDRFVEEVLFLGIRIGRVFSREAMVGWRHAGIPPQDFQQGGLLAGVELEDELALVGLEKFHSACSKVACKV